MASIPSCIEDLRKLAKRRIPRAIFDYADRGAYDEVTLRRNRAALQQLQFRQRVMVDVSQRELATTLLGRPAALPLAIAPTGLAGLFHRDGEICGARAAAAAGVPFCLSTMSICSIEDLRAAVPEPFWFQLYLMRDRGFNAELMARAQAAQCSALMLTLDLPVQGERRQDARNGLRIPPRLTLHNAWDVLTKPRWVAGVLWVRERWPGKLILKGVLDPEDARRASAIGADAIVVSNHGGRQLDGAPATIAVLPAIADVMDPRCELLLDGGIQSGQDLLKALALGARGGLIGKAYLYALAALGERGVALALQFLRNELSVSMALTGCVSVQGIDRSVLMPKTARG